MLTLLYTHIIRFTLLNIKCSLLKEYKVWSGEGSVQAGPPKPGGHVSQRGPVQCPRQYIWPSSVHPDFPGLTLHVQFGPA